MSRVWQPSYYGTTDFSITLDGEFARQAYGLEEDQEEMNKLGNKVLEDYPVNWKNPYRFKGDSFLATSIHLEDNGTWIATTDSIDEELFDYHPHNVDKTEEVVALQHLFGKWVKYTEALLEGG